MLIIKWFTNQLIGYKDLLKGLLRIDKVGANQLHCTGWQLGRSASVSQPRNLQAAPTIPTTRLGITTKAEQFHLEKFDHPSGTDDSLVVSS